MKVTFTKTDATRYHITISRDHQPDLAPREAPGYDEHMPHELAHFLVEVEFGLRLGVFGQLAAGGEGVSRLAPADGSARAERASRRLAGIGRDDLERSERLVVMCQPLWEAHVGRTPKQPAVIDMMLATPMQVEAMMRRFDEASARWEALPTGGSIEFEWPDALTLRPGSPPRDRGRGERVGARRRDAARV